MEKRDLEQENQVLALTWLYLIAFEDQEQLHLLLLVVVSMQP